MATPETLRDNDLQTRPQDLTDQEAQAVTFSSESKEWEDEYASAKLNTKFELIELKTAVDAGLEALQNHERIKERKPAEKIISNLKNDLDKFIDDKWLLEIMTLFEMKKVPDEYLNKDIVEKTVKIIEKINQLITKYLNEIINLFKLWLQNNFKYVPEPMWSHLVKNKDKIWKLVNLLPSFKLECNKLCKRYCTIVRNKGIEIWKDTEWFENFIKNISSELKSLDNSSEIKNLIKAIVDGFPHPRNYYVEKNWSKIYTVDDIHEIVHYVKDFPKDWCIRFETDNLIFDFSSDNGVRLIRKNNNEEINTYLNWYIDWWRFCVKDEKWEVIWDYFPGKWVSMRDFMKHINEDLAREIVEWNWRSYINLRRLESIDEYSARVLINNFKGRTINFEDLKIIDVPTAKVFATFPGEIHILLDAEKLTDNVAEQLIPIKERLITSGKVIKKIEEVETKIKNWELLNNNLWNLKMIIENTNTRKDWNWERIDIKFNQNTNMIKSWWEHEVKVEEITENSMRLEWLDLQLSLQEWVWLANFKNRLKATYWSQEVKSLSFGYPFIIGRTRIIKRETLEKFCPICRNNDAREKIRKWLNK